MSEYNAAVNQTIVTVRDLEAHQLADAVWNYLGFRTADEFGNWYMKLRDDIDALRSRADDGGQSRRERQFR